MAIDPTEPEPTAEELALAMDAMASLGDATTESQVNSRVKSATSHLTKFQRFIDRWEAGLNADPKGRTYPKVHAEAARLQKLARQADAL